MADFRIKDEVGASVFAILSGLSLLFLTAWIFGSGGCARTHHPKISSVPDQTERYSTLEANLAEESKRRAELASELNSAKNRNVKLAAEVSRLRERIDNSDVAGLKLEISNLKARLEEENTREDSLRARLVSIRKEKEGRIRDLEQKLNALGAEKNALNAKLASASQSGSGTEELQKQIATLKKQIEEKEKKCSEEKAALRKEIQDLKSSLDQAKYGNQLKRAVDFPELDLPLLVNDPANLNPEVRPLFIRLRSMGDSPENREKVYAELAKEGKTEALHIVPFSSGSAEVASTEKEKLAEKLKSNPKSAKYLVVGYASVDGEPKANYELSSNRASNVAQQVAELAKLTGSDIQAVYFGQTKRFSTSDLDPNRVVEVWRVK